MTIKVAITTDFEVFSPSTSGNIDIDIDKQMLKNGYLLLEMAEKYGLKITYFLEVIEILRFLETGYQEKKLDRLFHFIRNAHALGHDIQIHAHSEWVTARLIDNTWVRAYSGPDQIHEIMELFFIKFDESINLLRHILGDTWDPICFRAGAYRIEPANVLFPFLYERGFLIDSSQHRNSLTKGYVYNGLLEIPILGTFPTKEDRWDMNLSRKSINYIFEFMSDFSDQETTIAVMQGHTKMETYWEEMTKMMSRIQSIEYYFPTKMSELR